MRKKKIFKKNKKMNKMIKTINSKKKNTILRVLIFYKDYKNLI